MLNLSLSEKEQMVIDIKSGIDGNKVHPKIKFMSILTHFHIIQNMYDFL